MEKVLNSFGIFADFLLQKHKIEVTLRSGLDNGQSINHIFTYAGDALPICERTVSVK